jgi:hypothetical protein
MRKEQLINTLKGYVYKTFLSVIRREKIANKVAHHWTDINKADF